MKSPNNKSILIAVIALLVAGSLLYAYRDSLFIKSETPIINPDALNQGSSTEPQDTGEVKINLSDLPTVPDRSTIQLTINSAERSTGLSVEVVNTDPSRSQGLSGRKGLIDGKGMLFAFPVSSAYSFWMKDMKFALDMIWIDRSGNIVHIEKNVKPETYPKPFATPVEAQFVLEVSAGFSDFFEVKVGDKVSVK